MFVIKEKFTINLELTQSTNQLCIESGAKIFDEIDNTLIIINSESQIYLPYNKTFVYFSVQEKKYITFRKAIKNERYILLFEVNKLNNKIFNIIEFVNTEENIITFSPTKADILYTWYSNMTTADDNSIINTINEMITTFRSMPEDIDLYAELTSPSNMVLDGGTF